jgi:hypothetical protein
MLIDSSPGIASRPTPEIRPQAAATCATDSGSLSSSGFSSANARIPTRKEQARNTLGIIFATAMLTTLAVLWFTGYWRYCL